MSYDPGDGPQPGPMGRYGPLPNLPGSRRWRRPRGKLGCLSLLVLVIIVLAVVYTLPNPWALDMGGRFSLTESWQGYGAVNASDGGRYQLYLDLRGGLLNGGEHGHDDCSGTGCNTLAGTAKLCGSSGKTYTFAIHGAVHSWWSTDGAATSVDLSDSPPLPEGIVVALDGAWHGPVLELHSPDNSWTETFTPAGAIRPDVSTANMGTATTTIKYGSESDFDAACKTLAA